ncbi:MAG: hypothetical protein ACI4XB_07935 [Ruminococcus sp.]
MKKLVSVAVEIRKNRLTKAEKSAILITRTAKVLVRLTPEAFAVFVLHARQQKGTAVR